MSRILVLSPAGPPRRGGIATYAGNLQRALSSTGSVVVCVIARSSESRSGPLLSPIREHLAKASSPLVAAIRFVRASVKFRPTVVQAVTWRVGLLVAVLPASLRPQLVVHCHGSELLNVNVITQRLRNFVLHRADVLVAVSEYTARIARDIADKEIDVIFPGIERAEVMEVQPRSERTTDGSVGILSVGRLVDRKGHIRLVEAVRLARNSGVDLRLVIAGGDGPMREALMRETGDPQNWWLSVHVNVTDSELDQYHRSADIFALLSQNVDDEFEGFGLAFVEAAAYGLPVLAGLSGGSDNAVLDGENCIRAASTAEAAAALVKFGNDASLRRSMGEKSRVFARLFTCDRWGERLIAAQTSAARTPS
jgi:phosphatidylinositol alpha-1,6-mannosyltransferase